MREPPKIKVSGDVFRYSSGMRIRSKLATTYTVISLLGLTFISALFYFYVREILTTSTLRHLESVSSLQRHRIDGIIDQNLERIDLVSSRTQLRITLQRYIANKRHDDYNKLLLILNDALKSISSFNVISILDRSGRVIVSTRPTRLARDYSQYVFFDSSRKENNASHFFLDEKDQLQLYLSGPLLMNDALIGVLLIEASANNIISLVADYSGLGRSGETLLGRKSRDGQYVEFITPTRFDANAALRRKVSLDNKASLLVNSILTNPLPSPSIDYRNKQVLGIASQIAAPGWGLVVKLDEDEALQPVKVMLKYIAITGLGVTVVLIWVSYVLAGIISRPIVELTRAARGIHEGDFGHRAVIRSNDEVGVLADTFNSMTDTLIHSRQDLEKSNRELHAHRDHLEELVSMRTRELQNTIEELESFSYSVSHDLRSPLRAIDGYSYMLMENYEALLDEAGRENFKRIRLAAQRMGALIDDLLKLAHINRSDIVREQVDLSAKVKAAINRVRENNNRRKAEFSVQPDVYAYVDEALIDIVVGNLLDNAWKYTENKSVAKIEFGSMLQDGQTVYFLRDNGVGFDMQYAGKIFGAFQRLVGNDEYPGTGIGLATVSRVISRHGGKVWAQGQPEKGATFYFTVSDV